MYINQSDFLIICTVILLLQVRYLYPRKTYLGKMIRRMYTKINVLSVMIIAYFYF